MFQISASSARITRMRMPVRIITSGRSFYLAAEPYAATNSGPITSAFPSTIITSKFDPKFCILLKKLCCSFNVLAILYIQKNKNNVFSYRHTQAKKKKHHAIHVCLFLRDTFVGHSLNTLLLLLKGGISNFIFTEFWTVWIQLGKSWYNG